MVEVFVLFLMGIILIVFNAKAVLREKESFKSQLDFKKKSMEDVELEIGKIREEFGKTIFEIQEEIEDLKKNYNNHNNVQVQIEENKIGKSEIKKDKIENEKDDFEGNEEENKFENYNDIKIDEIKHMIDNNLPIDEISKKTGIGKGELILIKQLYIK
jgi:preprotein translocase subunit SecF